MKGKYSKLIQEYCEREGIYIPPGFWRHTASHLAVIRYDGSEPKLVAKIFFKMEDLKYYIESTLCQLPQDKEGNLPARVIGFKENKHFKVAANGSLIQL